MNLEKFEYHRLKKPSFTPPDWVFGPVWAVLYALIAISAFRVVSKNKRGKRVKIAYIVFSVQLALNILWPILFFKFKLRGVAFEELLIMLVFIILTIVEFYKIDKIAAFLLIPYLLWSSFASVLNGGIWYMNRWLSIVIIIYKDDWHYW